MLMYFRARAPKIVSLPRACALAAAALCYRAALDDMQLRHLRSIAPSTDGPNKVVSLAWAPNSARLALATADRVVSLFDENGERKDKFPTKAVRGSARSFSPPPPPHPLPPPVANPLSPHLSQADPARKEYFVTGLAWSPDSSKLAVAQSDNIVFVYKVRDFSPSVAPRPATKTPHPPRPSPSASAGPRLGR